MVTSMNTYCYELLRYWEMLQLPLGFPESTRYDSNEEVDESEEHDEAISKLEPSCSEHIAVNTWSSTDSWPLAVVAWARRSLQMAIPL